MSDNNTLPIEIELPDGFLDEEERCGFTITAETKKIWAVEIDLLAKFDDVCKRNGIQYFASCGTALGAVRHHGFIPWDDDVDVMMLREEYDKLCKIGPDEFQYPYFFQTEETDPGVGRCHAQIRNSKTTAILKREANENLSFNQGIFLDIFPLDNVPNDRSVFEEEKKRGIKIRKQLLMRLNRYHPDNATLRDRLIIMRNTFIHAIDKNGYRKYLEMFDRLCRKYNDVETDYVAMLSLGFEHRAFRLRSDFKDSIDMDFEFIKLPVPVNYDGALTRAFGDWRKIVRGGNDHGDVIFSVAVPYKEYLKEKITEM